MQRLLNKARRRPVLTGLVVATMMVVVAMTDACSSPTRPAQSAKPPIPTLLVTNDACDVSGCRTLELRAFVWKFAIPQEPYGLEVVGEVHNDSTCLRFPSAWRVSIDGGTDTTSITWTPADTTPIYLFAVDSAVFHSSWTTAEEDSAAQHLWPYDGSITGGVGHTANFVVGTSEGWHIEVPYVPPVQGAGPDVTVAPTAPCEP